MLGMQREGLDNPLLKNINQIHQSIHQSKKIL